MRLYPFCKYIISQTPNQQKIDIVALFCHVLQKKKLHTQILDIELHSEKKMNVKFHTKF